MIPIVTFFYSAGIADVWLGMAPLWHPLGPQMPLKTPQKNPKKFSKPLKKAFSGTFVTPSDFCDSAGMADVWLGLAPS